MHTEIKPLREAYRPIDPTRKFRPSLDEQRDAAQEFDLGRYEGKWVVAIGHGHGPCGHLTGPLDDEDLARAIAAELQSGYPLEHVHVGEYLTAAERERGERERARRDAHDVEAFYVARNRRLPDGRRLIGERLSPMFANKDNAKAALSESGVRDAYVMAARFLFNPDCPERDGQRRQDLIESLR